MEKTKEEIIMAGFGGQGILFLGKVLAEVGMHTGKNVSWIPSYGPEMRGGTANCSVVISEQPIASPIVLEPDTLVAMNLPSVTKFMPKVKKGGLMLYNSSLIPGEQFRNELNVCGVPASDIAGELGDSRVANLVMVGAYVKQCNTMTFDDVMNVLPKIVPAKRKEMAQINASAFKRGYEWSGNA